LEEGILLRRYKRFFADIRRLDGTEITIHCPNTGSMKQCLFPGGRIWFSDSGNSKRKYPCTWEQAEIPVAFSGEERLTRAGLNTGMANKLVRELLESRRVPELAEYHHIRAEVPYREERSRIDFLLQQEGLQDVYVEVKSVTLAAGDGLGLFPDAVTSRGTKHLRELIEMRHLGHRAILFFCVQHTGIDRVAPADEIDPVYGKTLREAVNHGVELAAWGADVTDSGIELTRQLPVEIAPSLLTNS